MTNLEFFDYLMDGAEEWQKYHPRDFEDACNKVLEEVNELEECFLYAYPKINQLDEFSDVLVNVCRAVSGLSDNEKTAILHIMRMKIDNRIYGAGKNKTIEKGLLWEIACEFDVSY